MTAIALLTACGSQEGGALAGAAAQPTGSGWIESWTNQVKQNPAQDVGAQDLPTPSFQELIADWRTQQVVEAALAEDFRNAAPPLVAGSRIKGWIFFNASDLDTFASGACSDAKGAAIALARKLPGLSAEHAPLIDRTMQLIPHHCGRLDPSVLDAASNVFFTTMVHNEQISSTERQTSATPAPAPSSTADQVRYQAVCAMGQALGQYLNGRAKDERAKAFGVVALAAAGVYCRDALKGLFD
ncbi:hypothetical protein AB0953_29660 [Streptomyces sp. NPDC046866]|uniref:hypothetical protein n=1 Tax=Streptomyces sp. NPDC046866 TaxID=3154921 RepID=UPI003451BA58